MQRIIVIGGTGNFGSRICRRIAGVSNTELIICSRRKDSAEAKASELRSIDAQSLIGAAALDQSSAGFENDLKALRPDIVIHTAGPYQGQDYRVGAACIEAGSHYIDLADGRQFVQGFDQLHRAAEQRDVLLVSGASTLPGLSSVVIDSLRDEFESIEKIEVSIAPAHQTPRGASTIAAVLSYCGRPFDVMVEGQWVRKHGWQDLRRHHYPDLGLRRSGACDVPELGLWPGYGDGVRTVTFHAALEAWWEQIALWKMAWMVRAGIVRSWSGSVPVFQRLSDRLINRGSEVGGMHIQLSGKSIDGMPQSLTWNLTARQNHGPEIPCTPALILARKLARGEISARGAFPCLGMFSMSDFKKELAGFDIDWCIDGVS